MVSFVYKIKELTGVSKLQGKPAFVQFLDSLCDGEFQELLQRSGPAVAAVAATAPIAQALPVASAASISSALVIAPVPVRPMTAGFSNFSLDLQGKKVVVPTPGWLAQALEPGST